MTVVSVVVVVLVVVVVARKSCLFNGHTDIYITNSSAAFITNEKKAKEIIILKYISIEK